MTYFEKLRSLFTHRKQTAKPASLSPQNPTTREGANDGLGVVPPSPERSGDSDADPYGALSEIAAPEPVERRLENELARLPSLEEGLSSRGNGVDEEGEEDYWALSEIAAPRPVEKAIEEIARHRSLERRLSHASRR